MTKEQIVSKIVRHDYLYKFRRIRDADNLEKVIEHMRDSVSAANYESFTSAADHRRAELACKKLFDKVPSYAWALVK